MSTPDSPREARARSLRALADQTFDLVVVGGGITGCGIARDAALRGLKVALVEKRDFAAGTSSKSSKLVHGGLRYLEQAEVRLVFESVSERTRLMKLARHLVRPLPFLMPNFEGDRRWLLTLDLGLWIYDALCLFRSFHNHRTYGRKKTLTLEPALKAEGLKGGILYYDCLTDDARLTLENALDAQALGAVVVNHVRAGKLLTQGDRICGLTVHDEDPAGANAEIELRATVVVNATGPWSDEVRALLGEPPILKPTKGTHVVIDAQRLPVRHAMMLFHPVDKRVVFAIPWGLGRTVLGTTDTFFEGRADQCDADRSDADYLLETANHYFPEAKLGLTDVLATWSGLRPLLKPPSEGTGASQVSREHQIYQKPGFVTVAGGKLTTYRLIAAEVVDTALGQLQVQTPSTTATRPIPGAVGLDTDDALEQLTQRLEMSTAARTNGAALRPGTGAFLAGAFGARAEGVLARVDADPSAGQTLDPELPYLMAQVDEALDVELAVTLDDMLSRRVPMLLRGRDQGDAVAPQVAQRMAARLGWSPDQTKAQLADYRQVVAQSRRFRTA